MTQPPGRSARPGPDLKWVPREHGASFMSVHTLLLGIVAGAAAGTTFSWTGFVLTLVFGALVLPISGAVSVWSHPKLGARAKRRTAVLLGIFAIADVVALAHGPAAELLALGVVGATLGAAYALARGRTGPRSTLTELVAIACLSLLAPLGWLLIAGAAGPWQLSAPIAFLAFGGTVPYVRTRVRRRRFTDMTLGQRLRGGAVALTWQAVALSVGVAVAAAGITTWWVPVAYVPGAIKTLIGIAGPERKPPIKHMGYLETAISTLFAVLAGIGLGAS